MRKRNGLVPSKSPKVNEVFCGRTKSTLLWMKAERMNGNISEAVVQFSDLRGLHQVPDVNAAVLGPGEDASVGMIKDGLYPVT